MKTNKEIIEQAAAYHQRPGAPRERREVDEYDRQQHARQQAAHQEWIRSEARARHNRRHS
jgi:hypothetical protein